MATFLPEDYYPEGKLYEIFGKRTYKTSIFSSVESDWHEHLSSAIKMLEGKLGSPRIKKLTAIWYNGFEDRELKKLERSLLTVRITVDDIQREGKELKLWKLQHKHLKDLLCQVDDIVDDISLRAPQLKELFQSPQARHHPYLTEKLGEMNNHIQELDTIAAEIKSVVLPEFYNLQRRTANDHPDSSAQPGVGTRTNVSPPAVSSLMDAFTSHFATLTTSLSRIEARQARIEESQARIERKQASIAENMSVLFDGLTHVCQISGHSLQPLKEIDLSDSE